MGNELVLFEQSDGVGIITLNRPEKLNSFVEPMKLRFKEILAEVDRDDAIRCLVLTGAERADRPKKGFSTGQDLKEDHDAKDVARLKRALALYNEIVFRILTLKKPVIAAVNGTAAGAGWSIALACDLLYAADSAVFIASFINIGLVPDSGLSFMLAQSVGLTRAKEIMLSGKEVDAESGLHYEFVTCVVPHDKLMTIALEDAERYASGPTRSYGIIKRMTNRWFLPQLKQKLEDELEYQSIAGGNDDHREGVSAYLEKREPHFKGG